MTFCGWQIKHRLHEFLYGIPRVMVAVIAIAALVLGAANMGFLQGQANLGKSFFESDSHIVHHADSID